eukprot:838033-Rhodomonas_salina.3
MFMHTSARMRTIESTTTMQKTGGGGGRMRRNETTVRAAGGGQPQSRGGCHRSFQLLTHDACDRMRCAAGTVQHHTERVRAAGSAAGRGGIGLIT